MPGLVKRDLKFANFWGFNYRRNLEIKCAKALVMIQNGWRDKEITSGRKFMKPTLEQFKDYLTIRDSGVTNMFAVRTVCDLSVTGITSEICLYIMDHFDELIEEYGE